METFQGQLVKNGAVILDDVDGEFEVHTAADGHVSWSGYFRLAQSSRVSLPDQYLLLMDDGRLGVILSGEVRTRGKEQVVVFVGLSPLRQADEEGHPVP